MLNPKQRDTIRGLYDALATRIAHMLETGQREGALRPCDLEVTARVILSLVTWAPLARPWAHQVGPMGIADSLAAVTATVFDGFSRAAALPHFQPLDLAALAPRAARAFDRDAALACEARSARARRVAAVQSQGHRLYVARRDRGSVGTTKRTLHHHIGSKQDLVSACYERAFRCFSSSRIGCSSIQVHGCRRWRRRCMRSRLPIQTRNSRRLSPLVGHRALPPRVRRRFDRNSAQLGDAYHGLIRQGIEEGSIASTDDVEARALMLPGLRQLAGQGRRAARRRSTAAHCARGCQSRRARSAPAGLKPTRQEMWRRSASPWTDLLWLLGLSLLLIVTGLGLRDPWPADEPRFALVRDMVATGEWLLPRVGGDVYADKPPLFFG